MAHIKLKADTLDTEVARFAPTPLNSPVFVNSIPKSGTHLLKNVLRMFVPIAQHYRTQFIQWGNLQEHLIAFDAGRNFFSYGHLFFSDASAIELAGVRKLLLYRDPYSWVLARARFFLSDEFDGNVDFLKDGKLTVDELLSLMIFGIHTKAPKLADMYDLNVAAWLGSSDVHGVRYEDLLRHVGNLESEEAGELVVVKDVEPTDRGLRVAPYDEDDQLDRDDQYREQGGRATDLVEPPPAAIRLLDTRGAHGPMLPSNLLWLLLCAKMSRIYLFDEHPRPCGRPIQLSTTQRALHALHEEALRVQEKRAALLLELLGHHLCSRAGHKAG